MVQLQILSGSQTGVKYDARLPVTVGRSEPSHLVLDDPGVWPAHCKIQWLKEGMVLEVEGDALASVNNTPMTRAVLRPGDLITLGGVTLRFNFRPIHQSSLGLREWLTWIGLASLALGEVAIIYWLYLGQ